MKQKFGEGSEEKPREESSDIFFQLLNDFKNQKTSVWKQEL